MKMKAWRATRVPKGWQPKAATAPRQPIGGGFQQFVAQWRRCQRQPFDAQWRRRAAKAWHSLSSKERAPYRKQYDHKMQVWKARHDRPSTSASQGTLAKLYQKFVPGPRGQDDQLSGPGLLSGPGGGCSP